MHVCVCVFVSTSVHVCMSGLKPGQVIWINFFLNQVGQTQFIKYPALTQILHWITCINISIWS